MKLARVVAVVVTLLSAATPALAQQRAEGPWMVRLRALYLSPANHSDAIPALNVPEDAITVSDKVFPEADISYYLTPKLAAELILTYPQKHDVELNGDKIGSFRHLPPTLLAQFHPLPNAVLQPYVGAGVNLTLISSVDIDVPGVGALELEDSSVGLAGQAGVDVRIAPGRYLNLDVKKVSIRSDVLSGGEKVSEVRVDPWLFSAGLGIRF